MDGRSYERLSRINVHLTEAVYQLEQLGLELALDEAVVRRMIGQVDEVRAMPTASSAIKFRTESCSEQRLERFSHDVAQLQTQITFGNNNIKDLHFLCCPSRGESASLATKRLYTVVIEGSSD